MPPRMGTTQDESLQTSLEGGELRITLYRRSAAEDKETTAVVDRMASVEGGKVDVERWAWDQDGVVEGRVGHGNEGEPSLELADFARTSD